MEILIGVRNDAIRQMAEAEKLTIYAKGPNRQGQFAGFVAEPNFHTVWSSDSVFGSKDEAESHMHALVKAARLYIKKGTFIPEPEAPP